MSASNIRLLPSLALAIAALAVPTSAARADDEVHFRGNYWRDRNTRIIAPEASIRKEYGTGTTVEASYLLDAITSASASAGVATDQPFTELRNEVGARVSQKLGRGTLGAMYRYSSESDYWSHTAGVNGGLDFFQKNLSLALSYVYSHAEVAQRAGAGNYLWAAYDRKHDDSVLDSHYVIASASQVLTRRALVEGSYELGVLDGYQANPYRTVLVGGAPMREEVPSLRVRHSLTGALRYTPLFRRGALHYLTLYLKYRFYADSWGVVANAPEARAYVGLDPVELRLTARYYQQGAASFYRSATDERTLDGQTVTHDLAGYATGGVMYAHCPTDRGCYTGDSKLAASQSVFLELRAELALSFLGGKWALGNWLGRGRLGVSAGYNLTQIPGHYTAGSTQSVLPYAYAQYGNAWVAGLELALPL